MLKKRVAFLLPGARKAPSGGFKVVYEYANRLVEAGYSVDVVYPCSQLMQDRRPWEMVRRVMRLLYFACSNRYKPYSWFNLDRRVKLHFVWTLKEHYVPRADVYVATAVQTSVYLNDYKRIPESAKFYLIQGFETWFFPEEKVLETYRYPMQKIVIAEWLQRQVERAGAKATLIHNGFNFDYFQQTTPVEEKDKYCVSMLYHRSKLKGCADGLAALALVRERFPQLRVRLFGVPEKPDGLPDWAEYYRQPDQATHNRIYNEAAIFLGPSHSEGFCLTPPEAMQCGSTVVCTDIGGYAEVCKHEQTALIVPLGDVQAMADALIRLIEQDELRHRCSRNATELVYTFTWERAFTRFCDLIETA